MLRRPALDLTGLTLTGLTLTGLNLTGLTLAALLVASVLLGSLSGCQEMRKRFDIYTEVSDPDVDSPEWVVQQVIIAAMQEDESAGWDIFQPLLHSKQLKSSASERNWRNFNFQTTRRKYKLYLEDDSDPTYQIGYTEGDLDGGLSVYIRNEKSDMPTPCTVRPDAKQDNKWRITKCSL